MKKKEDLSDFEHGTDVCLTVSVPDGLLGRSSQPLKFTGFEKQEITSEHVTLLRF